MTRWMNMDVPFNSRCKLLTVSMKEDIGQLLGLTDAKHRPELLEAAVYALLRQYRPELNGAVIYGMAWNLHALRLEFLVSHDSFGQVPDGEIPYSEPLIPINEEASL